MCNVPNSLYTFVEMMDYSNNNLITYYTLQGEYLLVEDFVEVFNVKILGEIIKKTFATTSTIGNICFRKGVNRYAL